MKRIAIYFLASFISFSNLASAGVDTGLVGYWNFDKCDAADTSGNANNGKIEGNPLCVTGVRGNALQFNGIDDLVRVANPFGTTLPNDAPISTVVWVKTKTTKPAAGIITQHTACNNDQNDHFHVTLYGSPINQLQADSFSATVTNRVVTGNANIIDDKWHQIAFVSDGKTNYLYVDGTLKNSIAHSPSGSFTSNTNIAIGGFDENKCSEGNLKLDGIIDEARIYSRAITLSEVKVLYKQGIPLNGSINRLGSHIVTCKNETTGQTVDIPATSSTSYDCESKGLKVKKGDSVIVNIKGKVQ